MGLPRHPILLSTLLCSILLRVALGAPCCLPLGAHAPNSHAEHHAHHSQHADHHMGHHDASEMAPKNPHEGHSEDNTANPCCSACGPTLPSGDVVFAARTAPNADYTAQRLRDLAAPAPPPAYEATGPPLRV